MAGEYDYTMPDDERKRAAWMALAQASAGLLGAPRGREWQALGQGVQQGLLSYGDAQSQWQKQQMAKQHMAMQQEQLAQQRQQWAHQQQQWQDEQRRRAGMDAAAQAAIIPGQPGMPEMGPPTQQGAMQPAVAPTPQGFDFARYANAVAPINPQAAMQIQQGLQKESPFDKFKPEHYTPQSIAVFAQSKNPADLKMIEKEGAGPIGKINPSDFTASSVARFMAGGGKDYSVLQPIDKRPVSSVKITNVAETEESKAIGKSRGEQFAGINQAASKAQSRISALSAIDALMGDIETNALTPAGNSFAAAAKSFGITIDPSLPRKEAAQAFMNQLALESRSTADGGGMPGAMSDKDREFLLSMNPSMGQTTQGRKMLIEVQKRMAKRTQQLAQWAREYRALNGNVFDEGFQEFAAMKAERSPLFADIAGAGTQEPANPRVSSGRIGGAAPGAALRFDRYGNPI